VEGVQLQAPRRTHPHHRLEPQRPESRKRRERQWPIEDACGTRWKCGLLLLSLILLKTILATIASQRATAGREIHVLITTTLGNRGECRLLGTLLLPR
jgi:hypothetical protein